ncbi:MAG: FecR family protein [Pseudomonadota bacterium]
MIVGSFPRVARLFMALIYLTVISTPAALAQASADRVGAVTAVEGEVTLTRNGVAQAVKVGTPLHQLDVIGSKADGRARLLFNDNSIVSLAPGTILTINEFVYDPAAQVRVGRFRLLLGKIKCFVNDALGYKNKKFQVSTQTAVIGVRGTDFLVWAVSVDSTRVAGFSNFIDVANIGAFGRPIVVGPNFWTEVLAGQGPTEAVEITPAFFELLHQGFFPMDALHSVGGGAFAGASGSGAAGPVVVSSPLLAGLGPTIPGLVLVGVVAVVGGGMTFLFTSQSTPSGGFPPQHTSSTHTAE